MEKTNEFLQRQEFELASAQKVNKEKVCIYFNYLIWVSINSSIISPL